MSTSRRSSLGRQALGFLNANTVAGEEGTGGNGTNAAVHSVAPTKNEPKKKFRGVLTSIVTRSKGKKNGRSTGSESSKEEEDVSMSESPTKKTRVMEAEEDSKPSAIATAAVAATATTTLDNEFDASDVAGIFRQRPADDADRCFWDDEMEGMLELKRANPITDGELKDDNGDESGARTNPSELLSKELDENDTGEPILWSKRLPEDEVTGFKIHVEPSDA